MNAFKKIHDSLPVLTTEASLDLVANGFYKISDSYALLTVDTQTVMRNRREVLRQLKLTYAQCHETNGSINFQIRFA